MWSSFHAENTNLKVKSLFDSGERKKGKRASVVLVAVTFTIIVITPELMLNNVYERKSSCHKLVNTHNLGYINQMCSAITVIIFII